MPIIKAVRHLAFWKPYGVLSQFTPEPGSAHRTLADFIEVRDVYPAGRLDWDSEGLVILTSDGALQHSITDPRFAHKRSYWVQVEGAPSAQEVQKLADGVKIQDSLTRPAAARLLPERDTAALPEREVPIRHRASIPTSWLELILTEGRNRQVRRMTAAIGFPTLRLIRVASGGITLAGLTPGTWRNLKPEEIKRLGARATKRVKGG